jgi:glutamate carboxypeptidase
MKKLSILLAAILTCGAQEKAILDAVDKNAAASIQLLERLVNQNSGTFHPEGVMAIARIMDQEFRSLGFTTRQIPLASIGRGVHLTAERKGAPGARPILLVGHMDTVFEPSSPFQKFEAKGRTAVGPGTADMEGGLVVILLALRALHEAGQLDGVPIEVFLTGDEEAPGDIAVSRKEFIEAGRRARAALCFETGVRGVNIDMASTARRGFTGWELRSTGTTAHSGQIFSDRVGYGAAFEISRVLDEFQKSLREPNMTFNVGLLVAGVEAAADRSGKASATGKDNIVPSNALAQGEIRALSPEQVARIKDRMHAITAKSLPGTKSEITFREGYPPMAPTTGNKRLLALLNKASQSAGLGSVGELDPMLRGAGDISFLAPYVDSLSGLGAIGSGSHAVGESVDLESLPRQAKRAALLIHLLAK